MRKTGYAVVVDEGVERYGTTAELASILNVEAFDWLDAPVLRIGAADVPIPFSPALEMPTIPPAKSASSRPYFHSEGRLLSRPACLVTGSSSGIGAAIARQFAAQGYDVVVHYNAGEERAAQIAAAIRAEHSVEALVLGADLSQREAPFDLVDRTFAHFGRLDVAVSNSGVANYVADEQGPARALSL